MLSIIRLLLGKNGVKYGCKCTYFIGVVMPIALKDYVEYLATGRYRHQYVNPHGPLLREYQKANGKTSLYITTRYPPYLVSPANPQEGDAGVTSRIRKLCFIPSDNGTYALPEHDCDIGIYSYIDIIVPILSRVSYLLTSRAAATAFFMQLMSDQDITYHIQNYFNQERLYGRLPPQFNQRFTNYYRYRY
ncbi:hypothetical protein [Xenorhabdus eapokensis]|uniref:Uncharacterized protein n=1 Tax=Xenorhabdus eapokensis TaxID=1873482 RepID=A0A1Q5TIE8_9GAMM|nr:hypothetical protein [Xenorhabdus eapokensis]OKP00002.1 hypothetical protein Xedl_03471 [Xenorhabdus eapokensis]